MASSRFTRLKITIGFSLLLAIMFGSLVFVYREMEKLSEADDQQSLLTDSLMVLLREKDKNTLRMLRVLSEANDSLLAYSEVEETISEQDTVITLQRVQHRVATKRDTVLVPPKKKGFLKRLAEAFVPSKQDSAVLVNTSMEVATDTILEPTIPVTDSLQQKRRMEREEELQRRQKKIRYTTTRYQRVNNQLTERMDSLIKGYEVNMSLRAQQDAEWQQEVRMRSARTIAWIAIGAVTLSAFFLIIIGRDITHRNRHRKELEEANKRAEDLLEAREKMMLAITHDFKAPLGSIMGYTDLLSRLTEDERQKFYLTNMRSSSEHLLKLVSDLLDFHRLDLNKEEVNRVVFNPAQLFEEIRVSFEPLTSAKGLFLKCEIDPELFGKYISDPLRIRQIVNNLLSNAVKFTSKGGITLNATYRSSHIIIDVSDTGKGMASEDRERIFQEFTRLPGAQGEEGFGLGLSIVKKLVTLLEGSINVESTLGEGSCFTVTLPLFPVGRSVMGKGNHLPVETAAEKEVKPLKALKVLLIDDDKIQLQLTQAMLEQAGMKAVCCEQIDQLIEQLRTEKFDVLLTDIQMPAINGFDLLKLLRASNIPQAHEIPIIAVTARSEMDDQSLQAHGFAGCLHKPFTAKELLAVVSGDNIAVDKETETEGKINAGLDFSALTAFSGDDQEAGEAILQSFIEETTKSMERMRLALKENQTDDIAAIAHKLLPLFTLIGASETVSLLRWLESNKGGMFTDKVRETALQVIELTEEILRQAKDFFSSRNDV